MTVIMVTKIIKIGLKIFKQTNPTHFKNCALYETPYIYLNKKLISIFDMLLLCMLTIMCNFLNVNII